MRSLLLAGACVLFACGDDDATCGEPTYLGDGNDEVWRTMVDGESRAVEGDPDAPVLSEPADGAEISASAEELRIAWTSPIAALIGPKPPAQRGPEPLVQRGPEPLAQRGPAPLAQRAPEPLAPEGRGVGVRGSTLSNLLEGTAWAHLPPVTGDVYWVRLTVPGRDCRVEAITTELEWTLAGDAWAAVSGAKGQAVRIDLTSAYLNENRITEGPYVAAPRTVTIAP